MKNLKPIAVIISVLLLTQTFLPYAFAALPDVVPNGTTIAVSVINNTGYRGIESQIEDKVIQSLRKKYKVVERAKLGRIIEEKKLRMAWDNTAAQIELGNLAGADYMMTIRVDKPAVKKNLFRKRKKIYEKLESLTVSASIRVVSVIDGTITDLKTVKKLRSGLEDKTYDDLPGITVEVAGSAIDSYIIKPITRKKRTKTTTDRKAEYSTWVYVAAGIVVVGAIIYVAATYEKKDENCVRWVCKKEKCTEYDASGNCIEWECDEKECVEWEEDKETSAAPVLHPTSHLLNQVTFSRHQVNHPSSKFQQLFGNFEVQVKLFEWSF